MKNGNQTIKKMLIMNISDLNDLSIGDPIVHKKYGIGHYVGLQQIIIDQEPNNFVVVEYSGEVVEYSDKPHVRPFHIYIPVASIDSFSMYKSEGLDTIAPYSSFIVGKKGYNHDDALLNSYALSMQRTYEEIINIKN